MKDEPYPLKAYKVTILVVDHDKLGPDGIKRELECVRFPNDCMNPEVVELEARDVEWTDEHPLNYRDKWRAEFDRLFGDPALAADKTAPWA